MPTPELTLVTKNECHLCADARATVSQVAAAVGVPFNEVSIDEDAQLKAKFAEEVPVVLINGLQRDFWKIDPIRLERLLREAQAE